MNHTRAIILIRASATLLLCLSAFMPSGCGYREATPEQKKFRPIDPGVAVFWDRQTTESAALLRHMCDEFNASWSGLPVKVERSGNYADIFRKITAGITAGMLPAMAVSYESMTNEYIPTGAVVNLDAFITDPELGLDEDTLADFFPGVIETNRFPEHGNGLYSFPFAKSVLMLYFNAEVLKEAGIDAPPTTWSEFIEQCRRVKAATGCPAHAVHADCSTVNGMIFSHGGNVIEGRETLYDSSEALEVFRLYETLAREGLAYLIAPGSYDDNVALSNNEIAFVLRSSSGISDMLLLMEGDTTRWGVTSIPQKFPNRPATALYGPNVCLFNTSEEQTRAAWAFIKHLTSVEASTRWALETGYLPVRKSALEHPDMLAYWSAWEYYRKPYESLAFARPEPNVSGWQQVRDMVARAVTEIMTGVANADTATSRLKKNADQALARVAQNR